MSEDFHESAAAPLEKIKRRALRHALEHIEEMIDEPRRGDTPIEKLLFLALDAEICFGRHEHTVMPAPPVGSKWTNEDETCYGRGDLLLVVQSQAQLEDWRVDFLISTDCSSTGTKAFLIVECDGHDFHERTKSQAAKDRARDRKYQAAGYTVFRFTGSEIWKDPCACADQIIDWAVDKACLS